MSGLPKTEYRKLGIALLVLGIIGDILYTISYYGESFSFPVFLAWVSVGCILLGLYLILVVRK